MVVMLYALHHTFIVQSLKKNPYKYIYTSKLTLSANSINNAVHRKRLQSYSFIFFFLLKSSSAMI